MTRPRLFLCLVLAVAFACFSAPAAFAHSASESSFTSHSIFAWRWWDDVVAWVRNISWDRGRMVQIWLLFVLAGLYIILRIKPKA